MKLNNKITLSFILASSLLNAVSIDSVGVNVGCTEISYEKEKKQGTITYLNTPDESYLHGELYILLGDVFDSENYKPTINYKYASNSEMTNNLLLVGINRYFNYEKHDFYLGLLVGSGQLEWNYNPLNYSKSNDYTTLGLVGAVQAGAEYKVTSNLLLGVNTKYYMHNYSTRLVPKDNVEMEINHPTSCSLSVGLRYVFGQSEKSAPVVEKQVEIVEEKVVKVAPTVKKEIVPVIEKIVEIEKPKKENMLLGIRFDFGSEEIKEQYQPEIDKLVTYLNDNPQYEVIIEGHTDSVGREEHNLMLSQKRADIVVQALIKAGVDIKRVSAKGMGELHPIVLNNTEENKAKNRRMEAVFSKINN